MTGLQRYSIKHLLNRRSAFCAYCGVSLAAFKGGEDEHVIGRRFVPKGTLAGQWNLIVSACPPCNDHKADLEDDISAISMQPDTLGRHAIDDPRLISEARRKARTHNRRTRRRVSEPTPPIEIQGNLGPITMNMSFASPAQPDERRLFELARLQLAGFFSMITYDAVAKRGYWWRGDYAPVVFARREDWGNPHLLWVDSHSRAWDYRLHAITADGFYKIWIRRRLGDPAIWAWAMEWNQNIRVAGFVGDREALEQLSETPPPPLRKISLYEGTDRWIRYREEVPLPDEDDHFFDGPDGEAAIG